MFAMINRKEGKILDFAPTKSDLSHLVMVNLNDLDTKLAPAELRKLYRNISGSQSARMQPKRLAEKICSTLQIGNPVPNKGSGSVLLARHIIKQVMDRPFKEVMDECGKHGLNYNTAKTQYYAIKRALPSKK